MADSRPALTPPHPVVLRKLRAAWYAACDAAQAAPTPYARAVTADLSARAWERLLRAAGLEVQPASERPTVPAPAPADALEKKRGA